MKNVNCVWCWKGASAVADFIIERISSSVLIYAIETLGIFGVCMHNVAYTVFRRGSEH